MQRKDINLVSTRRDTIITVITTTIQTMFAQSLYIRVVEYALDKTWRSKTASGALKKILLIK